MRSVAVAISELVLTAAEPRTARPRRLATLWLGIRFSVARIGGIGAVDG